MYIKNCKKCNYYPTLFGLLKFVNSFIVDGTFPHYKYQHFSNLMYFALNSADINIIIPVLFLLVVVLYVLLLAFESLCFRCLSCEFCFAIHAESLFRVSKVIHFLCLLTETFHYSSVI